MTYQTAVFDLDGTLLDTLEDLYRAVNHALTQHKLPSRSREEVRLFVGDGVEMLIRRAVPAGCDEETILATLGKKLADGLMETLLDIPVQVDEGQPQLAGEGLTQSGFPRPHISDQENAYHFFLEL